MPGSPYNDPPTFVPLQKLTAALQNQLSDAIRALHWWSQGGSLCYSYDADQLEELLKPAVDSLLQMGVAGVPSWIAKNAVGGLHAKGIVNFSPNGQTFAGGWADITGATLNLTLTATCTILVLAGITGYQGTAGRSFFVRAVVNAVADADPTKMFNGGQARNEGLPYIYYATGVPAGVRNVKMQCAADTDANHVERGRLIALAFAE